MNPNDNRQRRDGENMKRTVVWYSCGAASAVAAKLTLEQYPDALIVCCVIPSEHPDNERFMKDCEKWYGKEIIKLKSDKYKDPWDVFEKTRYLVGPYGARCTTELKKIVRQKFQKLSDRQVFGFTSEESDRADRFRTQNPEPRSGSSNTFNRSSVFKRKMQSYDTVGWH